MHPKILKMNYSIPIDIYQLLDVKLGKEDATKVSKAWEATMRIVEKEVRQETIERKIELRDELRQELASKTDIILLKQDISGLNNSLQSEIKLVKSEFKTEFTELRGEMKVMKLLIYFIMVLVAIFGTFGPSILGFLKLFIK